MVKINYNPWLRVLAAISVTNLLHVVHGNCAPEFIEWNGYCYLFKLSYEDRLNWYTASQQCRSLTDMKGYLVSIGSTQEQSFISTKLASGYAWIGLYKTYSGFPYIWDDGSASQYRNWMPGAPAIYDGSTNCVVMYGTTGWWDDTYCSWNTGYICKYKQESSSSTSQTSSVSTSTVALISSTQADHVNPNTNTSGCCNAAQVAGLTVAFLALTGIIVCTVYIVQRLRKGRGLPFFYKPDGAPPMQNKSRVTKGEESSSPLPDNNAISNPNYEEEVIGKDSDA